MPRVGNQCSPLLLSGSRRRTRVCAHSHAGKNRPTRCHDGAKRRVLVACTGEHETRNIRPGEHCASRRREPSTSGKVKVNGGKTVRRPSVLSRESRSEVSTISNHAV